MLMRALWARVWGAGCSGQPVPATSVPRQRHLASATLVSGGTQFPTRDAQELLVGGPEEAGMLLTGALGLSAPSSGFCAKPKAFWENAQAPKRVLRAPASGPGVTSW